MLGDPELKKCKVGDIIQLQRRGFFKVDQAYSSSSSHTNISSAVILFEIPDGHQKPASTVTASATKNSAAESKNVTNGATAGNNQGSDLHAKIAQQGNVVRDLKAAKAEKSKIDGSVKALLALKAEFKAATGKDWSPNAVPATQPASQSDAPSSSVS